MTSAWGVSWGVGWGGSWGAAGGVPVYVPPPMPYGGDGGAGRVYRDAPDRAFDRRFEHYIARAEEELEPELKKKRKGAGRRIRRTEPERLASIPPTATLEQIEAARRVLLEAQRNIELLRADNAAIIAALVRRYDEAIAEAVAAEAAAIAEANEEEIILTLLLAA